MVVHNLVRSFVAPMEHACLFIRDVDSEASHDDWNPAEAPVDAHPDSILIGVQAGVDGPVSVKVWRGEPEAALSTTIFEGSIRLQSGRLSLHDPNEDIVVQVPYLGGGGPLSILVDDADYPTQVQVVLGF